MLAACSWLAGCWLLALGSWLLVVGCWLLAAGCWLLAAGCWLLTACCWLLVASCWLLAASSWLLVVGSWLLAAACWVALSLCAPMSTLASLAVTCVWADLAHMPHQPTTTQRSQLSRPFALRFRSFRSMLPQVTERALTACCHVSEVSTDVRSNRGVSQGGWRGHSH